MLLGCPLCPSVPCVHLSPVSVCPSPALGVTHRWGGDGVPEGLSVPKVCVSVPKALSVPKVCLSVPNRRLPLSVAGLWFLGADTKGLG